jgi:hypothetical protein
VRRKGMAPIIAEVGETEAKAKSAKPDDFLDMRFVDELEKEGFFKKLSAK